MRMQRFHWQITVAALLLLGTPAAAPTSEQPDSPGRPAGPDAPTDLREDILLGLTDRINTWWDSCTKAL